jgi:hypothetical protein
MPYLTKLILCLWLLLAYVSFAQSESLISTEIIPFEDSPGDIGCTERVRQACQHQCVKRDSDSLYAGIADIVTSEISVINCGVSAGPPGGRVDNSDHILKFHKGDQVVDIHMLHNHRSWWNSGTLRGKYINEADTDSEITSFQSLNSNAYIYVKKEVSWGISYYEVSDAREEVTNRRSYSNTVSIFRVLTEGINPLVDLPLADYSYGYSDDVVDSSREWLEIVETLSDQLTYTLDWPNALTISVNPGTEPTEAQLEWVGVHDLSSAQP